MLNAFKGLDILSIAVEVEKNGKLFYEAMEKQVQDDKSKKAFNLLAREEEKHIGDFEKLMNQVADYQPAESYTGEYMAYVKALADDHVFNKRVNVSAIAGEVGDAQDAIKLAMRFEKDSILFFEELSKVLRENEKKIIDELIAQEKQHIQILVDLKKELEA